MHTKARTHQLLHVQYLLSLWPVYSECIYELITYLMLLTVISLIDADRMTDGWSAFKHHPVLWITQIDLTVMEQMKKLDIFDAQLS